MTPSQFEAITRLMRGKPSPSKDAARLVLVDGMGPMDAARETGASPSAVSNAVRRVRDALALASVAAGE